MMLELYRQNLELSLDSARAVRCKNNVLLIRSEIAILSVSVSVHTWRNRVRHTTHRLLRRLLGEEDGPVYFHLYLQLSR